MGMFDFFKSSTSKKWIYISIGLSVDKDIIGVLKRKLLPYAKELDWEIEIEKDKEESNISNIFLVSKERGDTNAMSPLEFKKLKRKLFVFVNEIAEEVGIKKLTEAFDISRTKFEDDSRAIISFNSSFRIASNPL